MHDHDRHEMDRARVPVPEVPGCERELPSVLTVWQAACLLRIGRSTAYEAIRFGTWPTRIIRVGRCIRIPTTDVLALLHARPDSPE